MGSEVDLGDRLGPHRAGGGRVRVLGSRGQNDPVNTDPPEPTVDRTPNDLEVALALADLADAITLPPFAERAIEVGWKADRTEVTALDRAAEEAIRERLAIVRPDDGVYGEELGSTTGSSGRQWIVDPIDGTSGYTRAIPVWATLIALTETTSARASPATGTSDDGPTAPTVTVAVVSAPALGRRWWATRGGGAFADGRRCAVSTVADLAEAQVSVTINRGWLELGAGDAILAIAADARRARGFGDFWQHMLVAEGALDAAIDAVGVAPYDLAACRLIVAEAGGAFTDRHGRTTHLADTAISGTPAIHAAILSRLGELPA